MTTTDTADRLTAMIAGMLPASGPARTIRYTAGPIRGGSATLCETRAEAMAARDSMNAIRAGQVAAGVLTSTNAGSGRWVVRPYTRRAAR